MQSSWKKYFQNKALFYSYSMIGSHSRLFPAIKHPAKINLPNVDYFSTWQFNLYDKSDGNPSEIQGTTHCRTHRSMDSAKKFTRFLKEIYHWLTKYTKFHTTIPT